MTKLIERLSWLGLIVLLISGCSKAPPTDSTHALRPGGSYVSDDGVVLAAPEGALDGGIEVRVVAETPSDVALPEGSRSVAGYYRLSASHDTFSLSAPFVVAVPVPDDVDHGSLALALLQEPEDMTDLDGSGRHWQLIEGVFDASGRYFISTIALLAAEGRAVTLVAADGYVSPSLSTEPIVRSQQTGVGFTVRCRGFDEASNNRSVACGASDEADLELVLEEAFTDYTGVGFALPYLTRLIDVEASIFNFLTMQFDIVYGDYLAELRPLRDVDGEDRWPCGVSPAGTTNLGGYASGSRSFFVCIGTAGVNDRAMQTARHEYFHATQYAYAAVRGSNQSWVKESTATASERSLTTMSRDASRSVRVVTEPLTAVDPGVIEYETQDFFVYTGSILGRGLDYLIDLFQEGASTADIDRSLTTLGVSGGLAELYWDWVKNQALEKVVDLGDGILGTACAYSLGGATVTELDYHHVSPPSDRTFSLAPLATSVVRMRLLALPDASYSTQVQVATAATGAGASAVKVKFYDTTAANTTACRSGPDSPTLTTTVEAGRPRTYLALISNTSLTDSAAVRLSFGEAAPALAVINPSSGGTFSEGDSIEFLAVATGFKRATPGTVQLTWTYPRYDGVPFSFSSRSGEAVYRDTFCDGTYMLTVEAIDASTSRTVTDTVTFTVTDTVPPPPQCAPSIEILTPAEGAKFALGAPVSFRAVFNDDHPETAEPIYPINWYEGGPDGLIIARDTATFSRDKFSAGMHEIYVEYGSANASVLIEVVDTNNTAPTANITSPADGDLFSWDPSSSQAYINVSFSGTGNDLEDGALSGAALTWAVREQGAASWSEAGSDNQVTMRFNYSCQSPKAYQIQLEASDSEGLFDVHEIEIVVVSPPC